MTQSYAFLAKTKEAKKIRRGVVEFFVRLMKQGRHTLVLDATFMGLLLEWLIILSRCA
jgi:hypothetical protein